MRKIPVIALVALALCLCLSGCSKEAVLGIYNTVIQIVGQTGLTNGLDLEGNRSYGVDRYTGKYTAEYADFSGTETLFGGTSIHRAEGKEVLVNCTLEIEEGSAGVLWFCGSEEPIPLLEVDGSYQGKLTLPEGGNYFGITGEHFTGRLELLLE